MTAITIQNIGKYRYIYLSNSEWDTVKQYSTNKKHKIGKFDLKTGLPIFTREFLENLRDSPELMDKTKLRFPNANLELIDEETGNYITAPRKRIGTHPGANLPIGKTYFIYHIAESIGLLSHLKQTFPEYWKQIFTIATFLIFENKAIMECKYFIEENITFRVGTLFSQRTSELFFNINYQEYNNFISNWFNFIKEREYIAYDATSIPSYSLKNEFVEFGKAKSNPALKQVNLCLLYGEKSKLPVYQTVYSGSLNDVTIILNVLKEFESIVGTSDILFVNDKGFFSKNNIQQLLKTDIKFLIAVPCSNKDAKEIFDKIQGTHELSSSSSIIYTSKNSIRGTTIRVPWYGSQKLYTHIFFDCYKALQADTELKEDLKELRTSYLNGELSKKDEAIFHKYFIVDQKISITSKNHIIDNEDEIQKCLWHEGWLIMISNHTKDTQDAYNIYVNKDCVEKAFREYKQNLGMDRIRTSSGKRFANKASIAFIALILNSHIHHVMSDTKLYDKFTRSTMLREIDRMNVFHDADGVYQLETLTKTQKNILENFEIKIPNRYSMNFFIKNIIKY
jgi:transposase